LRARLTFIDAPDALARLGNFADAGELRRLIGQDPGAAVLFANVLGQLPFLAGARAPIHSRWAEEFLAAMGEREWASFHDLLSLRAPGAPRSAESNRLIAPATTGEPWHRFLRNEWGARAREARDHGTSPLAEGRSLPAKWWPLAGHDWHLIVFRQGYPGVGRSAGDESLS
jgi:hypothetical protein